MKKIYIASPFFNEEQIKRVEKLKNALVYCGKIYYSPKDVNLFENGKGFDPEVIFQENLRAIKDCEYMIAITNDKDQGTHWEMGYAHALEIPVIAIWLNDDPTAKFNLMLSQSCIASFTSFEDLIKYISHNELIKQDYEGLIE